MQLGRGQSVEPSLINEEELEVDCGDCNNNCFTSEIIEQSLEENCLTRTIQIDANNCKYALSHLIIQVTCGNITDASNSENWPMILNSKDPKSDIWGLKVDDIRNFGDDRHKESFTVTYTVCSSDETCLNELQNNDFVVGYKASTCLFVDTLTPPVVEQPPFSAEISSTNVNCFGSYDGSVSVTIIEGTAPFSFLWNTGDTIQNLESVPAGLYSVTVTDSTGQVIELSAEVTQPEKITITGEVTNTSCLVDDGAITLNITGGEGPYNILWNDGSTEMTRTDLGDGSYSVKVTDANGCYVSKSFTVRQSSNLNVSINGSALECHQEGEGEINTVVTGGTEPYSYLWTTGDTTQNLYNLDAGRYQVTITDAEGCTTTRGGYVTIKNLSAAVVAQSPDCGGESSGSASLIISNGTAPYNIQWSNGDTSVVAENLAAGYYTVGITDVNGCEFSRTVIISEPVPLKINHQISKANCDDTNREILVILNGSGGTGPYTYYEDGQEINDTLYVQQEGVHSITMTDSKGCSVTSEIDVVAPEQSFNVSPSITQPSCENTKGSVILNAIGGMEPYNAVWSDGYTGMTRDNISAGEYTVEVTDAIGCSSTVTFVIDSQILPDITLNLSQQPVCDTDDNIVTATVVNATSVEWGIISETGDWYILNSNDENMTYHSGTGEAKIVASATSDEGCIANDTILVSCTDNNGGGDPGDGECDYLESFKVKHIEVVRRDGNCISFKMVISTDGQSEHELSHMVVGIEDGWLDKVTNSRNWKVEKNSTDPKSGVYGFKIDDISGFGQSGYDEFKIYFTICFDQNIPDEFNFEIVFKAATCSSLKLKTFKPQDDDHHGGSCIDLNVYPNPFYDESYFEFTCNKDTEVELHMYDLCGNRVKTLFKGKVTKGEHHKCRFTGDRFKNNMFMYQLITPEETKHGTILKRN